MIAAMIPSVCTATSDAQVTDSSTSVTLPILSYQRPTSLQQPFRVKILALADYGIESLLNMLVRCELSREDQPHNPFFVDHVSRPTGQQAQG